MPNENPNQVSADDSDPRVRLAVSARCSLMKLLGAPSISSRRNWIARVGIAGAAGLIPL